MKQVHTSFVYWIVLHILVFVISSANRFSTRLASNFFLKLRTIVKKVVLGENGLAAQFVCLNKRSIIYTDCSLVCLRTKKFCILDDNLSLARKFLL